MAKATRSKPASSVSLTRAYPTSFRSRVAEYRWKVPGWTKGGALERPSRGETLSRQVAAVLLDAASAARNDDASGGDDRLYGTERSDELHGGRRVGCLNFPSST